MSVSVQFLHDEALCMNLNDSHGIDAFLTESCPALVQALYLLSLKPTLSTYQTKIIFA
jgi:hypothetical protein